MKKFNLAIFIICSITKLTLAQCISITATSGEPACAGSTGVMSLAVTGGATPYSYAWQGGETTANISGLIAGCYRVTVTENGGCSVDSVLCLQNSTGPTVIYMNSTDASCFGSTDGIINSNVVGGTTPYSSIIWYNEYGTQESTGSVGIIFIPGNRTYYEVVTDNAGCVGILSVYVGEPTPMQSNISAQTSVSCAGGNDGDATMLVSGGTVASSYTYTWTFSNQTTATATGLSEGPYMVQAQDDNGCSISSQVTITGPNILYAVTNKTNVSCNGGSNGTATAAMSSGGISPYSYLWNTGQTTQAVTGLTSGVHTVTVMDQNSCQNDDSFTINEPLIVTASGYTTASICSASNGSSSLINASGGLQPYSYSWEYGANSTSSATGLIGGSYTVTISDANSCSTVIVTTVTDASGASNAGFTTVTMPCFGEANGSFLANVTGGTSPLVYQWDDGLSQNTAQANALVSSSYTVSVTDNNGCLLVMTDSLPQHDELVLTVVAPNTQLCAMQTDSVSTLITGGTTPYVINWSMPGFIGAGPHLVNLPPSTITTVTCTVTDGESCFQTGTAIYTVGAELLVLAADTVDVCHDDFVLSGTGFGGTAIDDYHWEWSTGFTEDSVIATVHITSVTQTTTFSVTLSDGCSGEASYSIVARMQPPVSGAVNVSGGIYYQGSAVSSGTAYLVKENPIPPFYTYTDTVLISNGYYSFQNILPDNYTIYVVPDTVIYIDAVPGYYGNTYDWSLATALDFSENCAGEVYASIYLNPIPLLSTGSGQLNGIILETTRSNFQFANIMVSLRDLNTDEIVAFDVTDELGRYRLRDIDAGNYYLNAEFPGYSNNYIDTIEFVASNSSIHQNICVANGDLSFTACNFTSVKETETLGSSIQVYPNPFSNKTTIEFDNASNSIYQLDIYSIQGTLVRSIPDIANSSIDVTRTNLGNGLYYFTLYSRNSGYTGMLVVD